MKMKAVTILFIIFTFTSNYLALNNSIVLIHGYNKNKSDMIHLKKNLEKMNYSVHLVNLPFTENRLNYAYKIFIKQLKNISSKYSNNTEFHLVGHSTGGLLIRRYLKNPLNNIKIGRSVQIATPNKGSQLADLSFKYLDIFFSKYKTLNSIRKKNIKKLKLPKKVQVELGAIAGNKSNSIYSIFIDGKDDGRIAVSSVKFNGLEDFIILPYGHKEIHHKKKTAQFIDNFLQKGKF